MSKRERVKKSTHPPISWDERGVRVSLPWPSLDRLIAIIALIVSVLGLFF